ncbi:MAG: AI-2E family transporter [Saprospiraceae bacterium]|nr:AI-2E family transporter [Saprospiraceae bacterium]MBK8281416.1 AI-2E family transporter [Saprospiraceae bacterium]MBK8776873.1 AI-2E family transporter [Saprospiraceae bacterium]MBK9929309.1 AI-2E family transporter [Saprospiraceae bacterium]MBL0112328.1 AI-2E family transporter [Saprospiraceae bacterium]
MTFTISSVKNKLLVLFLLVAGLYIAKGFLIPMTIGGIFATLLLPMSKWMEKKGVPRFLSVFICLLILLSVIAFIGILLGYQISVLSDDIGLLKEKFKLTVSGIQQFIFQHLDITLKEQSKIIEQEQPSLSNIMQIIAGSFTLILTNFILVLAYIFLFLYYRSHLLQFMLKLTTPSQRDEMEQVIYRASHVSQQYLLGLSKMIACLWIMYGIGFSILGVKNALFFAFLCGLFEIIPFVGNITGTSLTVLVSAVQGASLAILGGIVLTYGTVQFIQGWVLEPLILGPQVRINPFATIIALVLGGLLWGIPGVFLAIPLTAIIKIVCDHIESLTPFGFLIGEVTSSKSKKNKFS